MTRYGWRANVATVRRLSTSMEITGVRQQIAAMERRQAGELQGEPPQNQPAAGQAQEVERRQADLSAAIEQIQKTADIFNRELKFQVSDELNRVIVKVIDTSTDKVIREIPSQEIQRLQLQIQEAIGLLFDKSI